MVVTRASTPTTLSIDTVSGQILDADVEIDAFDPGQNGMPPITTSDSNVGYDLESIVTHEAGHFLGLAHSIVALRRRFRTDRVRGPRALTDANL